MKLHDLFKARAISGNQWIALVNTLQNTPDLIQELLAPAQLMLIAGQFGIGKTNELFHLMFSFAYSGTYHGLNVRAAPVLYIGWEGHPKKIEARLSVIEDIHSDGHERIYPWYIQMRNAKLPLDTTRGQMELREIVARLDPPPQVILLDPFKRTIAGDYLRPRDADEWIRGASELAITLNTAIIASIHTRKIIYMLSQPEDQLGADRIKGAGDLLDGVSCSILYAEIKGSKRIKEDDYSRVEWASLGTAIKVVKAKDAHAELPLLRVNLNRQKLQLAGKCWVIEERDGTVQVKDEKC